MFCQRFYQFMIEYFFWMQLAIWINAGYQPRRLGLLQQRKHAKEFRTGKNLNTLWATRETSALSSMKITENGTFGYLYCKFSVKKNLTCEANKNDSSNTRGKCTKHVWTFIFYFLQPRACCALCVMQVKNMESRKKFLKTITRNNNNKSCLPQLFNMFMFIFMWWTKGLSVYESNSVALHSSDEKLLWRLSLLL